MGRFVKNPILPGEDSIQIPVGPTAERPSSPKKGMLRFNETLNQLEFHNGTAFQNLQGGTAGVAGITVDTITLDGSTTVFPMSVTPTDEKNILVFMEGVFQKHSTYSISGSNITLTPSYPGDASKVVTIIHGLDIV